MRVVLDTNIVVSGLLWHGSPRQVLDAVRAGTVVPFSSPVLLAELQDVLSRPRADYGCGCARAPVVEKERLRRYDLGPEHCSRLKAGGCQVVDFLRDRLGLRDRILAYLRSLPAARKSSELKNSEQYLTRMVAAMERAGQEDPCLTVGDLMIALESAGFLHFFTLNGAESQHLCRALGQNLIVRPVDPLQPDVVCCRDEAEWPVFGKQTERKEGEKSSDAPPDNSE